MNKLITYNYIDLNLTHIVNVYCKIYSVFFYCFSITHKTHIKHSFELKNEVVLTLDGKV